MPLNTIFTLEIAFFSNLKHAKLQSFLPIRLNHNGLSGETKTSKCLDPHPTESYQCFSVFLAVLLSIYLSVSLAFLSGMAHYLTRIFKNWQSPFSRKIYFNIYFFILILYIYIHWNILSLVFPGNNPKLKHKLLLMFHHQSHIWQNFGY